MSLELPKDEQNLQNEATQEVTAATAADTSEEFAAPEDPYAAFANPEVRTKEDLSGKKRKNKIVLAVVLSCAFVLLVAAAVFSIVWLPKLIDNDTDDNTSDPVDTSVVLFDKSSTDKKSAINVAVMVSESNGTVEIINKDGTLYAKGYESLTPHAINMDALETLLAAPTMIDDIGEVEDLSVYGLDKPTLTATVTYRDGAKKVFEVGDIVPDQSGCYFREQGSTHVYIIDIDDVAILYQKSFDYISTTVFNEPAYTKPSTGETEVVLRNMSLGGSLRKDKNFSFRLVTSDDSDIYLYHTYVITEPFVKGSNSSYDTTLAAFTSLGSESILAVNPTAEQIKNCGLDDPYSVLKFTLAARTTITSSTDNAGSVAATSYQDLIEHTLYISKANSEYYYVMLEGKPVIYLVPIENISFAEMQYDDFADTLLFLEDIAEMGSFRVTLPDEETVFSLSHKDDIEDTSKNLIVTVDSKTYDTMDFRYLVTNFMDIKRYGALTADTSDLPLKLEIAITRRDATEPILTVKFYESTGNLYAVELSHGEKYMVKASEVNNAIEQYHNYLNGKTVLR